MMKKLLLSMAGSLSLILTQCADNPFEKQHAESGSKSVKIAIATPAHFDSIAHYATVRISGSDMSLIEQPLSILPREISGVVHQIPAGYYRKFEVSVYGYNNDLRYYGSAYADIFTNDTVLVKIILRKPGGTALISGYIEDFLTDSLDTPGKPYVVDTDVYMSIPAKSIIYFRTNGCSTTDSFDIGYRWTFSGITDSIQDSIYYVYNGSNTMTDTFPRDGFYSVIVQGYSYKNPKVVSFFSEPLYYHIKDGILVDSLRFQDSIPPYISLIGGDTIVLAVNDSFSDPGAKAFDDVDGDLTHKISVSGYLNPRVTGIYHLFYSVSDKAGNLSSVQRIVIVRNISGYDTIAPVLILYGDTVIYLSQSDTFIEPGYSAYDNIDGNITSKVNVFFRSDSFLSINSVMYRVTDFAGNSATAHRTILRTIQNETIATPQRPFIFSQSMIDTVPPGLSIKIHTNRVTSSSGDSVVYNWSFGSTSAVAQSRTTQTNTLNFMCSRDGYYAFTVSTTCKRHQEVKSGSSERLLIEVKNFIATTVNDSLPVMQK